MESKIYNQKAEETGKIKLPEEVFALPWNGDLVHQVTQAFLANARNTIAHAKDRSEVRGGGIKPWRQKGTGRARHGSIRSPIWVGGGVAHGPKKEKDYFQKVNKKMRVKALFTVLSEKMKDNEILFVNKISFNTPKTKEAKDVLESFSKVKGFEDILSKRKNSLYLALSEGDENASLSFGNFGNVKIGNSKSLNLVDILNYKYLVISNPEESLKVLKDKISRGNKQNLKEKASRTKEVRKEKTVV